MDTEALKAFVAVADTRSFSLAARSLFLTQPAVSKRVANLESQLNHALFDRLGKEVKLTEAGDILYTHASEILQRIKDAERIIKESSGEIVGTLRVATSHHVGLHHLPPVLRRFASSHKEVNLQFEFLDSELAHEKVLNGDCELAIVTLSPSPKAPLKGVVLWPDPLSFVVGAEHLLSTKQNLSIIDLCKESAILPDLNTFTGQLVKACFDAHDLALNISMTTNYLETIKMMVSVGMGWSVLPNTLVDSHMCVLRVEGVELSRNLGVIFHEKKSMGNAAKAFFEILLVHGVNEEH